MQGWYPEQKQELNKILDFLLSKTPKTQEIKADKTKKINKNEINSEISGKIHGLIVPHAGYAYSGEIAGKAFSLLKPSLKGKKLNRAIIFGPSHYTAFNGIASIEKIQTPLGKANIPENPFPKIPHEHSIENQVPFLQKLNPDIEILPIVVGQISLEESNQIAKQFIKEDAIFIFSTDLSHFLKYDNAVKKDKETIEIITKLNGQRLNNVDACGIFPILILFQMCKINSWKPKLIEYKNSGDITGDKSQVVGYASFYF